MSVHAPTISVLTPRKMTNSTQKELNDLLQELRPDGQRVSLVRWRKIAGQENLRVFALYSEGNIIGIATLRWHELASGRAAILEDVVVASRVRGRGFGERLMRRVLEWARQHGVRYIDLTSRPDREAANALYRKLGWKMRTTNVYRVTTLK